MTDGEFRQLVRMMRRMQGAATRTRAQADEMRQLESEVDAELKGGTQPLLFDVAALEQLGVYGREEV